MLIERIMRFFFSFIINWNCESRAQTFEGALALKAIFKELIRRRNLFCTGPFVVRRNRDASVRELERELTLMTIFSKAIISKLR